MPLRYFTANNNILWRWNEDNDYEPMAFWCVVQWEAAERNIDGTVAEFKTIIKGWREITLEQAKELKPDAFILGD